MDNFAPRRVFTAPPSAPRPPPSPPSSQPADAVETLYSHPSVKIVAFVAVSNPLPDSRHVSAEIEPGSLSWSSRLERTIAVGPFRIYRALGSVAFLNCGSALQPILPKSQCWCVDEASSKYVLQIRRPQYWRIEVPVSDEEGLRRAREMRETLDQILQFEKSECPFRRSFTVELPERPPQLVKRRPWTPSQGSNIVRPPTLVTSASWKRKFKADLKEDRARGPAEDEITAHFCQDEATASSLLPLPSTGHVATCPLDDGKGVASRVDDETSTWRDESPSPTTGAMCLTARSTAQPSFHGVRSFTAPPQLDLTRTCPSVSKDDLCEAELESTRSQSPADSQDSFHTIQSCSPLTPLPPSPPFSNPSSPMISTCPQNTPQSPAELVSRPTSLPVQDTGVSAFSHPDCSSEKENRTAGFGISSSPFDLSVASSLQKTEPRRPRIAHRATTSSSILLDRATLPGLPSASNRVSRRQRCPSTSSGSRKRFAVVRRLPMVVISKTYEILISPPSHLVNAVLNVAARIVGGEWRGLVFGRTDNGERINVPRDWTDDDADCESPHDGLEAWANASGAETWSHATRRRAGKGTPRMVGSFPCDDEDREALAWGIDVD